MRKFLMISAFTFALAAVAPALAQESQAAPQENAVQPQNRMLETMSQKLALSEQQKEQLKPILAARREKMQALRSSSERPRKKKHEAQQIMEDSDNKIKAVLTGEQWKQYLQFKEQMKEDRKERQQQSQ